MGTWIIPQTNNLSMKKRRDAQCCLDRKEEKGRMIFERTAIDKWFCVDNTRIIQDLEEKFPKK